jgi:hypothetical protein
MYTLYICKYAFSIQGHIDYDSCKIMRSPTTTKKQGDAEGLKHGVPWEAHSGITGRHHMT